MKKSHITFKAGTRSSKLALIQTKTSLDKIAKIIDGISFELIEVTTTGDDNQQLDLKESPQNFFTEQLDKALVNETIDCAIHSAKDLPESYTDGIDFFWLPWSEQTNDAIVLPKKMTIDQLPKHPVVGISSERRENIAKNIFHRPSVKKFEVILMIV